MPDRIKQSRRTCSNPLLTNHVSLSLMFLTYEHFVLCKETFTLGIVPSSDYLPELQQASLVCVMVTSATEYVGDSPLSWTRVGGLPSNAAINNSQQREVDMVSYRSTLTFTPTALDNQVLISCTASAVAILTSSYSNTVSYLPNIILVPNDPVITDPDRTDVDGNYTWTCLSDGASQTAPNVYWRNGNGLALITGVSRITTIETKPNKNVVFHVIVKITLSPATAASVNSLQCIAVHGLGQYSSRKTATKIVARPEVAKNGGDLIYTNENIRQTISCIILASSPKVIQVSWSKDGESIHFNHIRYEHINTTSPSLTILSVQKSDTGDYNCTVTNAAGSASFPSSTTLIVRYSPTVNLPENETLLEGLEGSSLTIPCPVDSVPYPTMIIWKRIVYGELQLLNISSNMRYIGGTARHQQYSLTIKSLQIDDAGIYFCQAINNMAAGSGPNMTILVTSAATSIPIVATSFTSTTAVVFSVASLVLLLIIILVVLVYCLHGKFVKRHQRSKVNPFMLPSARTNQARMSVPPMSNEIIDTLSDNISGLDNFCNLTVSRTLQPLPRTTRPSVVTHIENLHSSVSGIPTTRAQQLPPLELEAKSSDGTLRWSSHLQPTLVASYDHS